MCIVIIPYSVTYFTLVARYFDSVKFFYGKGKKDVKIKKIIKEGGPIEEILKVIGEEKIDLVVLRAHEESRVEHFLVGSSNDAIIRKMPCSIFLVKNELLNHFE